MAAITRAWRAGYCADVVGAVIITTSPEYGMLVKRLGVDYADPFTHEPILGVNAHLNSRLQSEYGGWKVFHQQHITHLAEAIDRLLPAGYEVDPVKGMQIIEYHPDTGERLTTGRLEPDLTIYDTDPTRPHLNGVLATVTRPTLTILARETIDDDPELYLSAVVVREVIEDSEVGKAVTWIELLSPSNKPPGFGALQYTEKRIATLYSNIVLVEIDYLHQTNSPIVRLPSYPKREPGAYPYTVAVTDPRPSLQESYANIYGFGVDDPMPVTTIPLAGEDAIALDLGAVYARSFSSLASFARRADYEQEPDYVESYTDADQSRIRARMAAVRRAIEQGVDLVEGPFPTEGVSSPET